MRYTCQPNSSHGEAGLFPVLAVRARFAPTDFVMAIFVRAAAKSKSGRWNLSHLDEFERLAKLRESGALSEEEFAAEKSRLLEVPSDRRRRPILLAGLAALLFLICAGIGLGVLRSERLGSSPVRTEDSSEPAASFAARQTAALVALAAARVVMKAQPRGQGHIAPAPNDQWVSDAALAAASALRTATPPAALVASTAFPAAAAVLSAA